MHEEPVTNLSEADERGAEARRPQRGRPFLRLLQLVSLAAVAGLFALFVWKVVVQRRGPNVVSAITHGKKPYAPLFRLPVIWPHTETWPARLRPKVDEGSVVLRELR